MGITFLGVVVVSAQTLRVVGYFIFAKHTDMHEVHLTADELLLNCGFY